jgi:hypothetical protein
VPRHYPPDRKADALQRLQANGGDILATHAETGVPQRTLYTWRSEIWLQQVKQRQALPPPPQKELPAFEDEIEGQFGLRQEIIDALFKLTEVPEHDTPFRLVNRVRAQARLVDTLMSLNDFLTPYEHESEPQPKPETPRLSITWPPRDAPEDTIE